MILHGVQTSILHDHDSKIHNRLVQSTDLIETKVTNVPYRRERDTDIYHFELPYRR